jgi:Uma2 family endonuclease
MLVVMRQAASPDTPLAPPRALYGWGQPTEAHDWTVEMFERLPADTWHYELVEGRVVRMPPPSPHHGRLESRFDYLLRHFSEAHGLGETYVGESGWDLTRRGERKQTVLASDVAFVRAERLPLPPPRRGRSYPPLAPDLVIEIASSSQARSDLGDKARHWLDRGVQVVWVAWPDRQEIDVWTPGVQEPRTLAGQDELTGGDIMPGLSVTVASMW